MLWVVTAITVAFALFPSYAGYLAGGGDRDVAVPSPGASGQRQVDLQIEGMSCEACAITIESKLREVVGVSWARVDYDGGKATVGIEEGSRVPDKALLQAVGNAGSYTAHLLADDGHSRKEGSGAEGDQR
jgi:copper chaperone CopZ